MTEWTPEEWKDKCRQFLDGRVCMNCILHKSFYCFMYPALDYTNDYDYCSYFSKSEKEEGKHD